ncbi:MAG: WYL domain-containing protein [Clostridia bacterium]|nr:WYL domain-containing protein [Clostridia bacterium]
MYTTQPKKLLIMNILDILKKYTDENHRLSQKEIVEILKNEYNMTADRKSVKRNLMNLIDFGYEINYSESLRMIPSKDGGMEESYILSDFYLERDFTDSELRLLIDGLIFSKHIPYSQCKELVGKLSGLSNQYFKARIKHISTMPDNSPQNKQLFYNIDVIDEAISKHRQISFSYVYYGVDKKLHTESFEDKCKKVYTVNPYQIAATNGRYYLICNYDRYDDVANVRLDRIADIKMLDTPVKPQKNVPEIKNGFNLPKHMAEHIYMFAGESVPVTFRAKKYIVADIIDWFGKDVEFYDETDDELTVRTTVNENAMRAWGLQYARHITVLTPKSLVNTIKKDLIEAVGNYK